jgi:hypothetical protein
MNNLKYIGIDFGTTTTIISYWDSNTCESEILSLRNYKATPTLIQLNENFAVEKWGYELEGLIQKGDGFVSNFKPEIDSSKIIFDQEIPIKTIVTLFLGQIKKQLESEYPHYLGERWESSGAVVIRCGCPVNWGHEKEKLLLQSLIDAGFPCPALIPEPIGASVYLGEKIKDNSYHVLDIGGGTTDISRMYSKNGLMPLPEVEGSIILGGRNYDQLVASDFIEDINRMRNEKKRSSIKMNDSIQHMAKNCRENLNSKTNCSITTYYGELSYSNELLDFKSEELNSKLFDFIVKAKRNEGEKIYAVGGLSVSNNIMNFLKARLGNKIVSFSASDEPQFFIARGLSKAENTIEIVLEERKLTIEHDINKAIEKTREEFFNESLKHEIEEQVWKSVSENWGDVKIVSNIWGNPFTLKERLAEDPGFQKLCSNVQERISNCINDRIGELMEDFETEVNRSVQDAVSDLYQFVNQSNMGPGNLIDINISENSSSEILIQVRNQIIALVGLVSAGIAATLVIQTQAILFGLFATTVFNPIALAAVIIALGVSVVFGKDVVNAEKRIADKINNQIFGEQDLRNALWNGYEGQDGLSKSLSATADKLWYGEEGNKDSLGIYKDLKGQLVITS